MLSVFRNGADSFSISTCPVLLARAHRRFIVNADEGYLLRELLSYPHGQKPCVVPFLRDDLKIVAQDGKLVLRHFSERHVSMNDRGGTTPYHSWIVRLLNTSQAMLPGCAHAAQLTFLAICCYYHVDLTRSFLNPVITLYRATSAY
jgi:hypothetical protein